MNSKTLDKRNDNLRAEIVASLEYCIRDLSSLLDSARKGDTLYSSPFVGSTMIQLPYKIEVLRSQERLAEDMKSDEEKA